MFKIDINFTENLSVGKFDHRKMYLSKNIVVGKFYVGKFVSENLMSENLFRKIQCRKICCRKISGYLDFPSFSSLAFLPYLPCCHETATTNNTNPNEDKRITVSVAARGVMDQVGALVLGGVGGEGVEVAELLQVLQGVYLREGELLRVVGDVRPVHLLGKGEFFFLE